MQASSEETGLLQRRLGAARLDASWLLVGREYSSKSRNIFKCTLSHRDPRIKGGKKENLYLHSDAE